MANDTILREVDEELQRDRLRKLWRNFGPFVIGAAVALVLGVAGYEGWTWWQNSNAARSSDLFYTALEAADGEDVAAAQVALDKVIAEGSGSYPMLARFREAALLASGGKTTEAIAAYDALATGQSDAHLRELALLLAASLLVDSGDVAAVQQRIGGLIMPENALRNAARETLGLTQYKAGQLDAAYSSFSDVMIDPRSGKNVRTRVQIYMAQLVSEGAKAPEVPTEVAAPTIAPGVSVGEPALDVTPPAADAAPAPTPATPAPSN